MVNKLYIGDEIVDIETIVECSIIRRRVHTLLVNGKYYVNKGRGDRLGITCPSCNKEHIRVYFTMDKWTEKCQKCLNGETYGKKRLPKNDLVQISDNIRECCLIHSKVHTLIVDDSIYLRRGDEIEFICSKCNKKNKKLFYSVEGFSKICSSCKTEETCMEKYGVKNNFQSPKTKQTVMERYGVESINQIPAVKDKKKKIFLEKYGNENPWAFGSNKFKEAMIETTGFDNAQKNPEIRKKTEETNIDRRGMRSILCDNERKEFGMFAAHGVTHNSYLESTIEKRLHTSYESMKRKCSIFAISLSTFDEYKNRKSKYESLSWKCNKCNIEFKHPFANGISLKCPKCNPMIYGTSKIEREMTDWIESLGIKSENTKKIISPYGLDAYISSHNLAIEFNGLYFHSEKNGKKEKTFHLMKTEMCNEREIQLIHIFENEWMFKKEIVKSVVKSRLGIYDKIVYARKCEVKELKNKEVLDFYNKNHLQGHINSHINIGLFLEEKLISVLSFDRARFNKKYDWEITRYASKLGYKIIGGFDKLWARKPNGSIITYSDKRWFSGSVYRKRMKELKSSPPSYWYIGKMLDLHNRMEFQKHKLKDKLEIFDENLTEWENMQINGWDRIWDCGNWVFEYIPK